MEIIIAGTLFTVLPIVGAKLAPKRELTQDQLRLRCADNVRNAKLETAKAFAKYEKDIAYMNAFQ